MAIYHLNTKPIKRSSGRSATASASYRCGVAMTDERTGDKHDYTKKQGVMETKCFMVGSGGVVELDRSELWNKAETSEKRKDGRTAREVIVNIPHELPTEERTKLVDGFAEAIAEKYECGVDYAIHLPDKGGDNRNHHAHIMMTTRNIELDKDGKINLTDKTPLEWENKKLKENELPTTQEQIKDMREHWAERANIILERNNIDVRIDHRSYKDQGKDMIPTVKMGVHATNLERQGIKTDVGDINREIKADREKIGELEKDVYIIKEKMSLENEKKVEPTKENIRDIKKDIKKFEQFIDKVAEDLHPEHVKDLENKAEVFVIEKGRPAYKEFQEVKKQEPKEPLNPFKKSEWKKNWQDWRYEYLDKLHDYKGLKSKHNDMKKDIKDLKDKGAEGSRGYAIASIKANKPELYQKYEKAVDKANEALKQERSNNMTRQLEQMREKRQDDRGFER